MPLDEELKGSLGKERVDRLKEWDFTKTSVKHDGKQIVLPADPGEMDLRVAAKHLIKLDDEQNMKVDVNETINCYPYDGLVAITDAMAFLFGWSSPVPTPSFFGPIPPRILSVQVGVDEFRQVPMGDFTIPAIPDDYKITVGMKFGDKPFVYIASQLPRKYEKIVRLIGKTAREFLAKSSIYKGKAVRIATKKDQVDFEQQPEFFATGAITEEDLHLNDTIRQMVETSILTPIKYTEKCLAAQVPLKRGVLLEGPYGTGKSLISRITSKIATQNGWTFILIEDVGALKGALELAKSYQPCVVFAEDLDRAVTLDRDDVANNILNTLDGVLSKTAQVMVVFTTNHVEKINKAMLRPGRLDAVISIRPPNAKTCESLIRYYGRGMIAATEDVSEACEALKGQIPATIREVVERSKLHSIPRTELGATPVITASDLLATAEQMNNHLALLNGPESKKSDADNLYGALSTLVTNAALGKGESSVATKDDIEGAVDEVKGAVYGEGRETRDHASGVALSADRVVEASGKALRKNLDPRVLRSAG